MNKFMIAPIGVTLFFSSLWAGAYLLQDIPKWAEFPLVVTTTIFVVTGIFVTVIGVYILDNHE